MSVDEHFPRARRDERYLNDRALFAANHGRPDLWGVMDHWGAYVGVGNWRRALFLVDALRDTLKVPGDVVEVGTWRGASLLLLAKTLAALTIGDEEPKRIHGFDTWGGFPDFGPMDNAETAQAFQRETENGQRFAGAYEELCDLIRLYDLPVSLRKGLVEETVPAFAMVPGRRVSFVLLDVDLYEPTKAALHWLHPLLSCGAIVLCDEYGYPEWPGETAAVDEFLAKHPGEYKVEAVTLVRQPSLWMRRL